MSLTSIIKKGIFLLLAGVILLSCTEESPLVLSGDDCSIISASISANGIKTELQIYSDRVVAHLDYNFDFSSAQMDYVLSEGATITPNPSDVNLSEENIFTVTSASGKTSRQYTYSVIFEAIESYCKENVCLRSQEEVDEFGSRNYYRAKSIVISGTEKNPITDLSPLNSLKKIDNNLTVKGFQGNEIVLDNIMELSSLDIMADSIKRLSFGGITQVDNLMIGMLNESYDGTSNIVVDEINFKNLEKVCNNFVLYVSIGEDSGNDGFSSLKSVYEAILVLNQTDMRMFSSLSEAYHLTIRGSMLESLDGLENLKSVYGILRFEYCGNLTDVSKFKPDSIGTIFLNSCTKLTNLDCFINIENVETVSVSGVPLMVDIHGLSNIRTINDGLYLRWSGLTDLDELSNLEHVGNTILLRICLNLFIVSCKSVG